MSVALLITSRTDPAHRELVPVAPQQIFISSWIPACAALQLIWVPMFETGIAVDAANAEAILAELERLRAWMTERTGYEHEAERLARLIDGVERARQRSDLDVFIG